MALRLPRAAVRGLTRGVVAPLLDPRRPLATRRRLLDLTGYTVPAPRGTRREPGRLGGVACTRVTVGAAAGPHQVLYLHGGAYQVGSPTSHRGLVAHLARAAGAPVHAVDYRLAPEHPYPAALDDAVAAFRALRAAGHPAGRIAVAGDSAGGGLAMALLLRLRALGEDLPGSAGLISPWLDLDGRSPAVRANARSDAMLDPDWLPAAAGAYRVGDPPELRPLDADLAGLPPLHVVAGADEILVGDADVLVEHARAAGVPVSYIRAPGMWHAYPVFAGMLAEADDAVAALGAALRGDCARRRPRVTVVGAGFAGLGLGITLRRDGWDDPAALTVLDKAGEVGGVWRENTYPGAACDVPSHLYSFTFAPGHEWSRRFAPQPDILAYQRRIVREHGLTPHLRLGTEVTEARWDAARAVWRLSTAAGDTLETDVLVPACGQLSRPAWPRIPGLESFAGPVFHSAQWDHTVDLTGKRVAVVGTGASVIQFVPAIADRASAITIFQRSAPYVIPKLDRAYRPWHRALFRRVPAWRAAARLGWLGFFEFGALGLTRLPAAAAVFRALAAGQLRAQVRDGGLRARLRPDYPVGCKRILISSDWYPAIARAHVAVVTDEITEVTAGGVRTADGREHAADVIVLGTGFGTQDYLAPMKVFGEGGRELNEAWRDGARAHLGMEVPGFPNMFVLYGPNTNVGSGSILYMLEAQFAYVRQALRALGEAGSIAVRPEVETAFDTEMQDRLADSVWTGCTSWYRTESGRVTNNWPGLMAEYRRRTSRFDPAAHVVTPLPAPVAAPR